MVRKFEAIPAKRESTPLVIGLVSPSGAGKTKSALRLADGIARVKPGPIVVVDTEAGRAKHHADVHKFLHIDMAPPFSPTDHIDAWKEALRHNPSVIIQDSMSHEWEGEGGILEMQEAELERMAGSDWKKRERVAMAGWIRPKREHNKMKQFMLQQRTNWILCFRAKEKIKPVQGGQPMDLGWQALGAEDLVYECTLKCLLYPGADGAPSWSSDKIGERQLMKLPGWFRDIFAKPRQLDEEIGELLGRWSTGGEAPSALGAKPAGKPAGNPAVTLMLAELEVCESARVEALAVEARGIWRQLSKTERDDVTAAIKMARERAAQQASEPADSGDMTEEEMAEILRQEAGE